MKKHLYYSYALGYNYGNFSESLNNCIKQVEITLTQENKEIEEIRLFNVDYSISVCNREVIGSINILIEATIKE